MPGDDAPLPRCPTCGGSESEDIGDDVRRCANCTRVFIPLDVLQDPGEPGGA